MRDNFGKVVVFKGKQAEESGHNCMRSTNDQTETLWWHHAVYSVIHGPIAHLHADCAHANVQWITSPHILIIVLFFQVKRPSCFGAGATGCEEEAFLFFFLCRSETRFVWPLCPGSDRMPLLGQQR